jgi:hypothetical protein
LLPDSNFFMVLRAVSSVSSLDFMDVRVTIMLRGDEYGYQYSRFPGAECF